MNGRRSYARGMGTIGREGAMGNRGRTVLRRKSAGGSGG